MLFLADWTRLSHRPSLPEETKALTIPLIALQYILYNPGMKLGPSEGEASPPKDLGARPAVSVISAASPLAAYRTETELVYHELRRPILTGDYGPGQRIVADRVAAQIGLSRVPVREAIVRLVGEVGLESSRHVGSDGAQAGEPAGGQPFCGEGPSDQ